MINVSKLYCDEVTPGDWIRYGKKGSGERAGDIVPKEASERRPIVVWNITRACNLKCVHCYNDSRRRRAKDELSTQEAEEVLRDLAEFGVPSVLFSGGEPLERGDLFELLESARELGLRTVISTNGTLITADVAGKIKERGVSYVGVSLDGIGQINDKFRGVAGAFDKAVRGVKNCQDAGIRVGLRLTLTQRNVQDLQRLFDFFEAEGIERACFYHLVPSGRGRAIADEDLSHSQSRTAIETILARTRRLKESGRKTDILMVDNHVDGVYLYLKLLKEDPGRAAKVWELLAWNGGGLYSSGVGIGCIDFHGKVHPDQFWWHYDLGDVRKRPFSQIWMDTSDLLLRGLKNRRKYIKGRCRLCKFFEACGGSLRVRADLHFGDPWAPEPACYLSDEEIGLDADKRAELVKCGEVFQMPD
ncbi:putative mycofactocin radical SAM maturase MftC [subsurface metagenome]